MIELYISTRENITPQYIVEIFVKQQVQCFVIENFTSCVNNCNNSIKQNKMIEEKGFIIKIFNLDTSLFKLKIWNNIQPLLKLSCAFVKCEDYMGCVMNWPNIFVKSNCPENNFIKTE